MSLSVVELRIVCFGIGKIRINSVAVQLIVIMAQFGASNIRNGQIFPSSMKTIYNMLNSELKRPRYDHFKQEPSLLRILTNLVVWFYQVSLELLKNTHLGYFFDQVTVTKESPIQTITLTEDYSRWPSEFDSLIYVLMNVLVAQWHQIQEKDKM